MTSDLSKEHLEQRLAIVNKELELVRESLKAAQMEISEYEQVTENAHLAIIKFQPSGQIEYINPFARLLFQKNPRQKNNSKSMTAYCPNSTGQKPDWFAAGLYEPSRSEIFSPRKTHFKF